MIRNTSESFLISHFVFELSTDFKYQLMTSFCVQITIIINGNMVVSYLGPVSMRMNFSLPDSGLTGEVILSHCLYMRSFTSPGSRWAER